MKCVEYHTNTIRINMQAVYFEIIQQIKWRLVINYKIKDEIEILVKLLPTSTLPWIRYL